MSTPGDYDIGILHRIDSAHISGLRQSQWIGAILVVDGMNHVWWHRGTLRHHATQLRNENATSATAGKGSSALNNLLTKLRSKIAGCNDLMHFSRRLSFYKRLRQAGRFIGSCQ
jgi:hypothetical protein